MLRKVQEPLLGRTVSNGEEAQTSCRRRIFAGWHKRFLGITPRARREDT